LRVREYFSGVKITGDLPVKFPQRNERWIDSTSLFVVR
jgi:hypothetical protein